MNTPIKQQVYLPVKVEDELPKPQEAFVFTPEQLNELLSNVIKDALDTAAESKFISELGKGQVVHSKNAKESISSTFEQTFKKYKV